MIDFARFDIFTKALVEGFQLLMEGYFDIWTIILTSLQVSGVAVALSLSIGIPLGVLLGTSRSVSRATALVIANAGMGLPPTVVGLLVAMTLSRRGPLGPMSLLYSQEAMVMAQVIISMPVVAAIVAAGVSAVPAQLRLQARSLGANAIQELILVLKESRMSLFAAVAAGFGSIISEVGAVQMVGGNLEGETRVMTTAIVLFTRMGRYGPALALALILLAIIVLVNVFITWGQVSADKYTKGAGK